MSDNSIDLREIELGDLERVTSEADVPTTPITTAIEGAKIKRDLFISIISGYIGGVALATTAHSHYPNHPYLASALGWLVGTVGSTVVPAYFIFNNRRYSRRQS